MLSTRSIEQVDFYVAESAATGSLGGVESMVDCVKQPFTDGGELKCIETPRAAASVRTASVSTCEWVERVPVL